MIYGTLRIAHYAQGNIFMVAMLIGYEAFVVFSLPFWMTVLVTVLITVSLLLLIERLIYRPILEGSGIYLFMCTIGMAIFLQNSAQKIFGNETFAFPTVFGNTAVHIGKHITIVPQNIVIILVSIIIMAVLALFVKKTRIGNAIKAVSMNRYAARLMGINFAKISAITYGVAGCIAAIAAVFTAPVFTVNTNVGAVGLKALIAALLGGFGNMFGAVFGGVILGLAETLGSTFVSSAYKDIFSYGILILILIFRPQGLLGRKRITKV